MNAAKWSGPVRGITNALNKICLTPLSFTLFAIIALIPVVSGDQYLIRMLVSCLMYGTLAMGFDLSAGFIGVPNWGYAALMGLGGYTSGLLVQHFGIPPWIGMFIGALAATVLGLFIGVLTLRMDGMFAALLAWFVGIILMSTAAALTGLTRGVLGLSVDWLFETPWSTPYFYVILVICFLSFIILRMITRSNLGLAFRALGQDQEAARTSGIDPLKYKVINFCVSCFIAGLCGGFYAHFVGILTPNVLATKNTVQILVIAYIGGRGSIWGPLVAAFLIIPIFEFLGPLMEIKYIIYGLLLILVMIFFPSGLAGVPELIKSFFKTRKK